MKQKKLVTALTQALIISLFMMLILEASTFNTSAETIEKFKDNSTEKEIIFEEQGTNNKTYFSIPKKAEIMNAQIKISGELTENPILDIGEDNEIEWQFSGKGYGQLGYQTLFNNNASQNALKFIEKGFDTTSSILLPKNALIKSAEIDVNGRSIPEFNMENIKTISRDTEQECNSYSGIITAKGNYIFVFWNDEDNNHFKYSQDKGKSWSERFNLSGGPTIYSAAMAFCSTTSRRAGGSISSRARLPSGPRGSTSGCNLPFRWATSMRSATGDSRRTTSRRCG